MLEYMYITNHPEVAQIIDGLGVDRVWIDLEVQGKEAEIDTLIQFLDGHRWIRIEAMDVENIAVIPDHDFVER